MAGIVGAWRTRPPATLAGLAVTELVDLAAGTGELPAANALVLRLEKGLVSCFGRAAPSRS